MVRGLLAALLAIAASAPAAAKWREASSDHFIIYSEESEAELGAFAKRLETFDAAMRHMSGMPDWAPSPSNRLTIYVVPSFDAVQKLSRDRDRNVAGFYIPRAGGSVAIVPRSSDGEYEWDLHPETVLQHEYAHHFMFQNYTTPFPAWYTEGFAEFYSTAKFEKDGSVGIGRPALHRAYGLLGFNQLSLTEMMDYRSGVKLSQTETENLYGRGWLLTHYLAFEPARAGQMRTYVNGLASGLKGAEAATAAFGDLKTLNTELNRYLKRRSLYYWKLEPGRVKPGEVKIRILRPGEDAVMELRIRSHRGVDQKEAAALYPEMRKRAAPHPADPWVQTVLAEAEYDAGNLAEADAAADRALAADPKYTRAMLYKGMIGMAKATGSTDAEVWKTIRQWFIKANKIDTEDAQALLLYYESFGAQGVRPTAAAVNGLHYAADLSREDPNLRMMAAREHLVAGKAKEARQLLETIAYNPHGGWLGEHAARILAGLAEGDTEAALRVWDAPPEPGATES